LTRRITPAAFSAAASTGLLAVELAGIDRGLEPAKRNDVEVLGEDVVEATLRQTAVDRHLAAFVALDGNARTGLLALDAASAGLALAGTDTAADALAGLGVRLRCL
jgi:hypothetical protein